MLARIPQPETLQTHEDGRGGENWGSLPVMAVSLKAGLCVGWGRCVLLCYPNPSQHPTGQEAEGTLGTCNPSLFLGIDQQPLTQLLEGGWSMPLLSPGWVVCVPRSAGRRQHGHSALSPSFLQCPQQRRCSFHQIFIEGMCVPTLPASLPSVRS